MHLPTFRIKCRFKISKFHYIRMKSRGFEIVVVQITFCGCLMCFEASATLPLYIDDYYFTLLWFIIYFFSFSLLKKSSVILHHGFEWWQKKKDCIRFHVCDTHRALCVRIMQWYCINWNMNHIQFRSVIRSNFPRSMKLYGCSHVQRIRVVGYSECVIETARKKEISHWEWK